MLRARWTKRWRPVPPVWAVPFLRRRQLPVATAILALPAVSVVGLWLSMPLLRGAAMWLLLAASVAWYLPALVVILLNRAWRRRMRERAREADGCLCIHCAYPIAHQAEEGVCPECGKPFRLADSSARWRAALKLDER